MKAQRFLYHALFITLLLFIVTTGAIGCQTFSNNEHIPSDPFSVTFGLGERDNEFTLSGNSAGHKAGQSSDFELILSNKSNNNTWNGEYYILLLDSEGIILEATRASFELSPLDSVQKTIPVNFPEGLDGPYGLSVILPDRGSSVSTIWIGEKTTAKAGPWPDVQERRSYSTSDLALAQDFVINSPTYVFDGIDGTLELINTAAYSEKTISEESTEDTISGCIFTFTFNSSSASYGDRSDQVVAEVITSHEAVITVEQGEIISAILDNTWDMVQQKLLN